MPDEITPPAGTPAETPTGENSTIRALRAEIDARNTAAKAAADKAVALEAQLKEIERAKLDETERLRLELSDAQKLAADAQSLRDEHGKFQSAFQGLYEAELAGIPDEKRELVAKLSGSGAWPDRLEALRNAKGLLGTAPTTAGTTTRPTTPTPTPSDPPAPKPFNPRTASWGAVLSSGKPTA